MREGNVTHQPCLNTELRGQGQKKMLDSVVWTLHDYAKAHTERETERESERETERQGKKGRGERENKIHWFAKETTAKSHKEKITTKHSHTYLKCTILIFHVRNQKYVHWQKC